MNLKIFILFFVMAFSLIECRYILKTKRIVNKIIFFIFVIYTFLNYIIYEKSIIFLKKKKHIFITV
jgi:hypothetical protein